MLLAGVLAAGAVFLSGPLEDDAAALAAGDVVLYASQARIVGTKWKLESDSTAAGGRRIRVPNAGAPKVTTSALITPTDYIEFSFTADANKDYHLWIRGNADSNYYGNDSAFLQFDKTLGATDAPTYRIGTASAITYILEDCTGAGLKGWGWQDNSNYRCLTIGPQLRFSTSGTQTIRIHSREDGLSIDQIVLSPSTYLWAAPGSLKNDTTILPQGGGSTPSTFKVAFYNIRGGQGVAPLPGGTCPFVVNANCTDATTPLNAWGKQVVQRALIEQIKNDPAVVALGLAESWQCASRQNVRAVLGWAAYSSGRNGVAIVARYGFAGAEQWKQLDTSLSPNPNDTMWVVRTPVCLNAACTKSMNVFTAHWYATELDPDYVTSFERQARQTIDFMKLLPFGLPHVLIGDLNVWAEGPPRVCGQVSKPTPVAMLRDAGYIDAWPSLHQSAEGFTGMWNRVGCGVPEGYLWKRIDYAWSRYTTPVSITRFAMVPAGQCAPSDHAGLMAEYRIP